MEGGAIDLSLRWDLTRSVGMNSFISIRLKPGADKARLRSEVNRILGSKLIMFVGASNQPEHVLCCAWMPSGQEHTSMVRSLGGIEGVESISSDTLQTAFSFRTWRDKLVDDVPRSHGG